MDLENLTLNKTVIIVDNLLDELHNSKVISLNYNFFSHYHGDYLKYCWSIRYQGRYYVVYLYDSSTPYGCIDGGDLPKDSNYTLKETIETLQTIFKKNL